MDAQSTVLLASVCLEAQLHVSRHNTHTILLVPNYESILICHSIGNGALNCVATSQLTCDNAVKERSGVLCRFKLPNGKIQDGAKQITSLSQAKVN